MLEFSKDLILLAIGALLAFLIPKIWTHVFDEGHRVKVYDSYFSGEREILQSIVRQLRQNFDPEFRSYNIHGLFGTETNITADEANLIAGHVFEKLDASIKLTDLFIRKIELHNKNNRYIDVEIKFKRAGTILSSKMNKYIAEEHIEHIRLEPKSGPLKFTYILDTEVKLFFSPSANLSGDIIISVNKKALVSKRKK